MSRAYPPAAGGTRSGFTVRGLLNDILAALQSSFSGAGDDANAVVGQITHNTTTDTWRAKGNLAVKTLAMLGDVSPAHGNCVLTLSGSNLVLKPWRGNGLVIGGVSYQIPSDGISLPVTGMVAETLYYVYAYINSGAMTLERATTTHSTHTDGVEIKTGDATRTLVGMARPVAGPAFSATQNCMLVRSWFNRTTAERRPRSLQPAEISRNNANYAEVGTTTRVEFLVWSDEQVSLSGLPCIKGTITINGYAKLMLDGVDILTYRSTFERYAAAETTPTYRYQIFGGSSTYQATTMPTKVLLERMPLVLTEGYHYTSIWINGAPCYLGEDSSRACGNTEIVIEEL